MTIENKDTLSERSLSEQSSPDNRLLESIRQELRRWTKHPQIKLTSRGDTAIKAVLAALPKDKTLLIPEEGGWISYYQIPAEKKIPFQKVHCVDAKIDLHNLQEKLKQNSKQSNSESNSCSAFLYQNPGGYFAEQPMKEIYQLCRQHHCLVIMDISGAIGTPLSDGNFADICVCSFGKWKLVEAGKGGFISWALEDSYNISTTNISTRNIVCNRLAGLPEFTDKNILLSVKENLSLLGQKITLLLEERKKIIRELDSLVPAPAILQRESCGFVVVVAFSTAEEKEKIINYCQQKNLEWTECPRYIRVLRQAVSIELKRLPVQKKNITLVTVS